MKTKITNYPPSLKPDCMGASAPQESSGYKIGNRAYFNNYRNETLSRIRGLSYEWGNIDILYAPKSNISNPKYVKLPQSQISMLDAGRQQEVDDFYIACQMHRDQYRDTTGALHPLAYFKRSNISYQCPKDPTSVYLKYPERYVAYKNPSVLPLTTERTYRSPNLPDRALTGIYNPSSDMAYKR